MMAFFKIIIILCMLTFIFLMLMVLGIIPYKPVVEFLKTHRMIQIIFAAMTGTGFLGFFAVITNIII